jgi:hypothetical protein
VFYPHLLCAGAFSAGFVNPYSSGYSADVILCWVTLVIWVMYEAKVYSVKYGWICLVLGVVLGGAVGFPFYLVLRNRQMWQMWQMRQRGSNG